MIFTLTVPARDRTGCRQPDLALWAATKEAKNDRPRQNAEQDPSMASRGRLQGLVYPLLGDFEMTGDRLLWWRPAVSDLPFFFLP